MNGAALQIGFSQLALTMVFVLVIGVTSLILKLKLERDLAVGTLRTFAQLFLMGYVLKFVFAVSVHWLTLLVFLVMVAAAAQIIHGRVRKRECPTSGRFSSPCW